MILVDPPAWHARGRRWSHLASDVSYDELHAFAAFAGLHPLTYDGDHYDVPSELYDDVVAAGAVPTTSRDLLGRIEAAGLRFRKRRGEKPLAALPDGLPFLPVRHRLDLIASHAEPPDRSTVAAVTFVFDDRGDVLLVDSRHRGAWEGPGGWRETGETPRETAARELAEEAGLDVPITRLVPCAYERVHLYEDLTTGPGAGRLQPVSHIAVYRASVTGRAPTGDVGPEGHALGWFGQADLQSRCRDAPWWPILDRLLRAAGSHS